MVVWYCSPDFSSGCNTSIVSLQCSLCIAAILVAPSRKKPKVDNDSIEHLNDVTAVSGVDLRVSDVALEWPCVCSLVERDGYVE